MKRAPALLLSFLLPLVAYAQVGQIESDIIIARLYGLRGHTTLTNVLGKVGTAEKTLVLDSGTWSVTNDVTIPTNINLLVTADSTVTVASGKVLTVDGFISSGDWMIFNGQGVVTGPCANPFIYDEWSITNDTYLGTPYSHIATNRAVSSATNVLWLATTNLVTETSNGLAAATTTATNTLTIYVTNAVADATSTVINVVNGNFVPRVTNDTTVGISNDMTWAVIKTNALRWQWIDFGSTLTFQFSNGYYTFSEALDFFDDYKGGGEVHILGNTTDHSLVTLKQLTDNQPLFWAKHGGNIGLIDGFTLIGSSTNDTTNTVSTPHAAVVSAIHSDVTCGSEITATNWRIAFLSSQESFLLCDGVTVDTAFYGFLCGDLSMMNAVGTTCTNSTALRNYRGWECIGNSFLRAHSSTGADCNIGWQAKSGGQINALGVVSNTPGAAGKGLLIGYYPLSFAADGGYINGP